jgi:hypothetical protein
MPKGVLMKIAGWAVFVLALSAMAAYALDPGFGGDSTRNCELGNTGRAWGEILGYQPNAVASDCGGSSTLIFWSLALAALGGLLVGVLAAPKSAPKPAPVPVSPATTGLPAGSPTESPTDEIMRRLRAYKEAYDSGEMPEPNYRILRAQMLVELAEAMGDDL